MKKTKRWLWWHIWYPFAMNVLYISREEKMELFIEGQKRFGEELLEFKQKVESVLQEMGVNGG